MYSESNIYEQPLNEHIRICLRLEHLFVQSEYYLQQNLGWDPQAALLSVLEILEVVDRPDLKSKLTNALHLQTTALTQLEKSPDVNKSMLRDILDELEESRDMLHNLHGKPGQELRDNEFLTAVKQRMHTPAGICNFTLPVYQLWRQQPIEQQQETLKNWFNNFKQLQTIINLLLQLTRDSTPFSSKNAHRGFYEESLSPDIPYQMIRVAIPANRIFFPEISVGRHRLAIYFYHYDIENRPTQIVADAEFELACCR